MSNTKTVMGQASNQYVAPTNVEDVFSTYLYTGTGSTLEINNGIDLDGEGGLVWAKRRTGNGSHWLVDTERGLDKSLKTNTTDANNTGSQQILSFDTDGFTLGNRDEGQNYNGLPYTSWTFRKAPKFFDVVTWTGTGGSANISHNLDATVGSLIIKRTDASQNWYVYHRGVNFGATQWPLLVLNSSAAASANKELINSTEPTDSVFSVASDLNTSGATYVAYLFASNDGDGGFGPDGDADIIKCGSAPASAATDIDLGFEPQWIMIKRTDGTGDWQMFDTMRGLFAVSSPDDRRLKANTSDAEAGSGSSNFLYPTPTGFHINTNFFGGGPYIYIAIRRGTKVPESATEVFAINTGTGTIPTYVSGFPVDMSINRQPSVVVDNRTGTRLTGNKRLVTNSTAAQTSDNAFVYDYMDGWSESYANSTHYSWMWKRAPGFFDVVAYTGDSPGAIGVQTISHNLGVAPEMIWLKRRNSTGGWGVLATALGTVDSGGTEVGQSTYLNEDSQFNASGLWGAPYVAPTSTEFTVRGSTPNASGGTYIAYLFASLDGISKVGSVSHTSGSATNVDCGFTSGARFILLKVTDSSGSWFVYDTTRGIVAGNDARLKLDSTAAENTGNDDIDPLSSGFTITSTVSTGSYIFYAIA